MAILKGDSKNNILNGGADNDTLYGYYGDDVLNGGDGNDKLDGGSGMDKLSGGTGNDIYSVDNIGDTVIEKASAGTDKVISSVSWTLGNNVENLILAGNSALNGTGNTLNNTITGNTGNNTLIGNAGIDTLDGSAGVDALYGGLGNDILKINDFNGDIIDGGTGGKDTLEVYGAYQTLALPTASNAITGIEKINFTGVGGLLTLNVQSVIDLSGDSNSLTVDGDADDSLHLDSKWGNLGVRDGYQLFKQGGATLYVNTSIDIVTDNSGAYKISTVATATNLSGIFNTDVQEITLDFGDKAYSAWGLSSIDLSGFGLEDKLIIAQHDGALNNGTAAYGNGNHYIHEAQAFGSSFSRPSTIEDNAMWQAGATKAALVSLKRYIGTSTNYYTYRTTTPSGYVYTSRYTSVLYSVPMTAVQGNIQLTGLPAGLADSQFVFI